MIDWTDAFDNSGYVPGSDKLGALWSEAAASYRASMPAGRAEIDLPYGDAVRERVDLFHPEAGARGLLVFVHGGYWHTLNKDFWSHLAAGPMAHDWAVAIPGYTLAPEAHITDITQQIATAIRAVAARIEGPIRLIGHSAGGHLVSRMICDPSPLAPAVLARIAAVTSLSGIHDLHPLIHAKMNGSLHLTEAEAAAESPGLLTPNTGIPIRFWVGAAERPELLRQTRLIAENWLIRGARVSETYEPGQDHFSVVAALEHPDSPLTKHLCAP